MLMKETMIFLLSCLLGAGFGLLYDFFRIIRLVFSHNKPITFVEDVFYFSVLSILSFSFFLSQTNGIVRGFTLFGELIGMVLYFFTVSIVIMNSAKVIIKIVKRLFAIIFNCTLAPIFRLIKWICSSFFKFFKIFIKKFNLKQKTDLN